MNQKSYKFYLNDLESIFQNIFFGRIDGIGVSLVDGPKLTLRKNSWFSIRNDEKISSKNKDIFA